MIDGRFDLGRFLRQGEGFESAGEGEDLPGLGCGMNLFEFGVHPNDGHLAHSGPGDRPLVWGGGGVVAFGHFRAVALLEHKFLLRQKVIREQPVEFSNFVQ